ncbi:MAG TPA: hydantoinase B/oxoprolinase family protein [Solirubrobacteraceae bacterium]|nr:hydantoinase B/oxoprolinase family protein [Solirubrobacteraceae bacterium]
MTGFERTDQARGIRLAVLSNRMDAVVRAMRNTLTRTSRSGVINVARDFSCAIVSHDCHVLHWAESLPVHAVSGPDLMARSMSELHPRLRRGDAFLHNSPYHGGGHAADYAIVVPVIDGEGTHHFTVVAKAHQADCGNSVPTTYSANARDVYEEGALIFPCVRVQSEYRDNDDVLRMCRMRVRVPSQWWGDYLALLGAARTGERRMLELGEDLGWDALRDFSDEWLDYSEQRMANAIRSMPAGEAAVTSTHDPVPAAPGGIPVNVKVRVRSDDGMIDIDLRENLDCLPCGMNLTECTTRAAAMIGIFNSVATDIPPNGGSARRINVLLRENCVVGIPRHPASCSVATTNVFDRLANAVQRALAGIGEGMGMAEIGVGLPPAVAVISGHDPNEEDAPFVNQLILAWTGGAGGPHSDGWLTTGGPGDGGALLRDSVEIDEMRHPIIIRAQHIVTDSEGAGRHRGAPGGFVEYGPTDGELEVIYLSDGTANPPRGARGGGDGAPARQYRRNLDGSLADLQPIGHVVLRPGETIVSYTTGGGGFGPPVARDPSRVLQDVLEGWISRERADEIYGVVIRDNEIDTERTESRRAVMSRDKQS